MADQDDKLKPVMIFFGDGTHLRGFVISVDLNRPWTHVRRKRDSEKPEFSVQSSHIAMVEWLKSDELATTDA